MNSKQLTSPRYYLSKRNRKEGTASDLRCQEGSIIYFKSNVLLVFMHKLRVMFLVQRVLQIKSQNTKLVQAVRSPYTNVFLCDAPY